MKLNEMKRGETVSLKELSSRQLLSSHRLLPLALTNLLELQVFSFYH